MTNLGAVTMSYDGEGRQTQTIDTGTGQTISYLYDGLGQRVQKSVSGGGTTIYVHDAFGQLAAEYDSAAVTTLCTTCYLSYDQLGSTREITDQNGSVVARHDYMPYGEEIIGGTAGRNDPAFGKSATVTQMFTGQERDGGTAMLDYFNARHFSAYVGGFMQADPGNAGADILQPQSWNGYGHVLGNPLGLVDPSGMYAEAAPPVSFNCAAVVALLQANGAGGTGSPCNSNGGATFSISMSGQTMSGTGGAVMSVASPNPAKTGTPPLAACESAILKAVNNKFKTQFTITNVTDSFRYSAGAPVGKGTLNLNFAVPAAMQPTKVAVGRYPVNPATYVLGAGATLHIPPGPSGADSPLTLPFNASQFTAHLDSALPYNPIGLFAHLIQDMSNIGGYKPCP